MQIIELGSGPPLVFVPGLQGRWEYTRPTVAALAAHFRVITFSLCDEPSAWPERSRRPWPERSRRPWPERSRRPFERPRGFDAYGDQIGAALDRCGVQQAVVCGLSFGGLGALNFASRFGERVAALVLASTPGPGFTLRRRHRIYTRLPWLFGALFLVEAPFRASPELKAAMPAAAERRAFAWTLLRTSITAPLSVSRMAARARLIESNDVRAACARITAPTLVVTGEPSLDFVVAVDGTSQYTRLISGARSAVLERTGHQGTLTRPREFAEVVRRFVMETRHAAA